MTAHHFSLFENEGSDSGKGMILFFKGKEFKDYGQNEHGFQVTGVLFTALVGICMSRNGRCIKEPAEWTIGGFMSTETIAEAPPRNPSLQKMHPC